MQNICIFAQNSTKNWKYETFFYRYKHFFGGGTDGFGLMPEKE